MKCSFCTSGHGRLRYTVQGIKRTGEGLIFVVRRRIYACNICYDKIIGVWLSVGHGLRKNKKLLKEFGKLKGFGNKKVIDAFEIMCQRSERRERMGIMTT